MKMKSMTSMNRISVKRRELVDLDRFDKEYQSKLITEWLQAYISYESIRSYLYFLRTIYEDYHFKVILLPLRFERTSKSPSEST